MPHASSLLRSARRATLIALPALALAASATPAGAMDHSAHAAGSMPSSHAGMAHAAPAHAEASMFEVGTQARPLVTRRGSGPLWTGSAVNAPGMTSHGTLGGAVVAERLAARRAEQEERATRARLSTADATKKLSKRCQKLIKTKAGKLSKTDRKRRTACLAQRRKLIAASAGSDVPTPTTTGVSAPAATVEGPRPTNAPPSSAAPASPTSPTNPTPTPSPGSGGGTGGGTTQSVPDPAPSNEPVYAAVGVTATEGADPFRLTRGFATADIVVFELSNEDSQKHNLFIAPADEHGEVSGAPVEVIGLINGQQNGTPTRSRVNMKLAPGRYKLICTVPGHGLMAVNFTVYAPTR